jgi:hypothetical protein
MLRKDHAGGDLAQGPTGFAGHRNWLLFLLAMALCCAAITGYSLINYPAVADQLSTAGIWAIGLLLLAAPVIWIVVLVRPVPVTLVALRLHAALYSVLLVIAYLSESRHHSGPLGFVILLTWLVLIFVLAVEALVAAATWVRMRGVKVPPFVYLGLTATLLGGWFCGVLIWSMLLPSRVIAAAEAAAQDRPYCIDLEKGPARSAGDLSGLNMRASNHDGWSWNFHALLVIGDTDRRYMNWSYRTGRFEPVSDSAREGLHLERIAQCAPKIHFARDWR